MFSPEMLGNHIIIFIVATVTAFIFLAAVMHMVLHNRRGFALPLLFTLAVLTALGTGANLCWQTGKQLFNPPQNNESQDPALDEHRAAVRKRIEMLRAAVPPEQLKIMPQDFYTVPGQQDWWRIPLVFPYQIILVDDFYQGTLEKFSGNSAAELNDSSKEILTNITKISFDRKMLLFERNCHDKRNDEQEWGILEFGSGTCTIFKTERQMLSAAMEKDFDGDINLYSMQHHYRQSF